MKIVNIMNFVRRIDERMEDSTRRLLEFTAEQLRLVNEFSLDNTFLLQYDALCDEDFVSLFKNEATEKTELGLWYEIVEPLTTACGMPYRSEMGWKWDWHIIPGFPMAYEPKQREVLIDEAMRKFRETFGYYPRTVASWVIDTHTVNYLAANYDIKAVAICRDQANTDAYTLLGGYFNQAYYPSKNNIFTPAQTKEMQTEVPVFRLLGPCPIHNYDGLKYGSDAVKALWGWSTCFTLEPCWRMGSDPKAVEWMFRCYYDEESLGFAYVQIGQENSFVELDKQVLAGTRMQIEQLLQRGDVIFQKMSRSGETFRQRFPEGTPATAVVAPDNWDSPDIQSVYYDCRNYTANLFRYEDKVFFRSLYLFDERVKDLYLTDTCTTFDAVFENLPFVDTMTLSEKRDCGLMVHGGGNFVARETGAGVLRVDMGQKSVTFFEDRIEIEAEKLTWHGNSIKAEVNAAGNCLVFIYKGHPYQMQVVGARIAPNGADFEILADSGKIILYPAPMTETPM